MCTFDMFIQLSSWYALFSTEFTSFHSTPQCILFMCSFNSAEDMYVFPQKLQIFTLHNNVYFWYAYSTPWQIWNLSHRIHKSIQSLNWEEIRTLFHRVHPLHPVCNFNFSFKSTPHFTLYINQEENVLKDLNNDREYILGYITFRLALLFLWLRKYEQKFNENPSRINSHWCLLLCSSVVIVILKLLPSNFDIGSQRDAGKSAKTVLQH